MSIDSSKLSKSSFWISFSEDTEFTISISFSRPNDFIKVTNGIFPGSDGNDTLRSPSFFLSTVTNALNPLLVENTFAIATDNLSSISTNILFGAKSSIATTTLSAPLIMKYPPGSLASSPFRMRSSLPNPLRLQACDFNIIGSLPISTSTGSLSFSSMTGMNSR